METTEEQVLDALYTMARNDTPPSFATLAARIGMHADELRDALASLDARGCVIAATCRLTMLGFAMGTKRSVARLNNGDTLAA